MVISRERSQTTKIFPQLNTIDFTVKKARTTKAKKTTEKAPKEDTKLLSLQLLREGKTPIEIAKERKMVIGTIEGHLAHYVANQEISAKEVIGSTKLKCILAAIRSLKTLQMNPIREHLGRDYTFGEIKIGVAAHIAEGL